MTHPTDDSLKPCPFCGGAASLHPRTCDKNTPYNPADRAFPVARCGQCGAEALGKDWGKPETAAEKWNTRALLAEQARPTQVMQEARETLLIAAANFGGVAPSARDRCIRAANALHEVYTAQPLKAEQAKDAAEDAELLDWLEAMTDKGYCPAVVFDDDGHWAVLFDGIQSTPGDGPLTSSFIAGTETAWHDSIRAAIRAARAAERKA